MQKNLKLKSQQPDNKSTKQNLLVNNFINNNKNKEMIQAIFFL